MVLQIICAFIATLGFGILFNVRDKNLFFASLGGALGWLAYLISMNINGSVMLSTFIASLVISIYAEIFSRVLKNPVTLFLICALIPLAPGSGMYYTILAAVQGDIMQSLNKGIETLSVAGLIALGIITVSTLSRLIQRINYIRHNKLSKISK
ncbi:MAG: threonine/serine exporter family protein [Clostridium sp.]|uniref:threonine/serine exporter family protein n=1 Tax=Clostridium culturomicium TaxID=1499683 RepID=UPI0005916AE6|nr:threonine/serine exporter family protein [Clostridium culturomicium]MDU4890706.1 threonine/serine exporter family protein [Clostridium sp.]MDU7082332.1 threonine/serine exporter family protein [Clostridium sp.]